MSTLAATHAVRAITATVDALEAGGVTATNDAGAFHPRPLGVLVGLPSLIDRGLGQRTFAIPVHVVSADPLNSLRAVDGLYEIADLACTALGADNYAPAEWIGGVNVEPLPSLLITATVTVSEVP